MITGSRNIFDSNGNLILPRGAIEEYRREKHLSKARYPTGVYVSCPRCGHTWERQGRSAGILRCRKCKNRIMVGEIL